MPEVLVPPARLARWVENFTVRHGSSALDVAEGMLTGTAEIRNGRLRHTALPHGLIDISGPIRMESGRITVDGLTATMSRYLIDEIEFNQRIEVQACTEVVDGGGAGRLEWLDMRDTTTGDVVRRNCEGLFLLLGAEPRCEWVADAVMLDERGFVLSGRDVPQEAWVDGLPPESLATSVPGIFAVGDVRAGSMKRVAAASGEGSSVVPLVHSHLETL